ncbi:reverse transcriptase family protein, partial [Pseudomonas syringae]|uniref:reverse transcriptase family protein n=1 Tax=Pseudomonas syringae TaxID=317 RepID=UPI0034D97F4F
MNRTFEDFVNQFVIVFIDDILIYSKTPEDHEQHLRAVLGRMDEEQLYAKYSKCEFWLQRVKFLGHEVSKDGIHVDELKMAAVVDWP